MCLSFASLLDLFEACSGEADVQSVFVGVGCVFSPLYVAEGIPDVG